MKSSSTTATKTPQKGSSNNGNLGNNGNGVKASTSSTSLTSSSTASDSAASASAVNDPLPVYRLVVTIDSADLVDGQQQQQQQQQQTQQVDTSIFSPAARDLRNYKFKPIPAPLLSFAAAATASPPKKGKKHSSTKATAPTPPPSVQQQPKKEARKGDYRVGVLGIEWFDRVVQDSNSMARQPRKGADASDEVVDDLSEVAFINGNTELQSGVVHLFRNKGAANLASEACDTVCVLAVPAYMSTADFLQHVGSHQSNIVHMRMIRNSVSKRFMVLIKFHSPAETALFHKEFNRQPFSSMAPEACHVLLVDKVEFKSGTIKHVFPIEDGLVELPTCPVCLERMDTSVSGVCALVCNHSFHCKCLAKWGDSSCPVCRYGSKDDLQENECSVCHAETDLWMCLICGHIGCGRYIGGHAASHYNSHAHPYAIELQTQRVWDYIGDGYVHRLITNKTDGKLVELPGENDPRDSITAEQHARFLAESKKQMEQWDLEWNDTLMAQLESQRMYYQNLLTETETSLSSKLEVLDHSLKGLTEKNETILSELGKTKEELEQTMREKAKQERKYIAVAEKYQKLLKESSEEGALRSCLSENYDLLKQQNEEKAKKIADLEEQLRDLMFYLETQQRVENSPNKAEIQQGQVIVRESEVKKSPSRRNK